jgi:hypothetical protein
VTEVRAVGKARNVGRFLVGVKRLRRWDGSVGETEESQGDE